MKPIRRFRTFQSMFKSELILLSIVGVLAFWGCSTPRGLPSNARSPTPETGKVTSAGVVSTRPLPAEIIAGEAGQAVVQLAIQRGYHVNANPPTYPYLIATELRIQSDAGVSAGKVTYPPAITGKFAFAEKPLAVYEGETELKVEISVDKAAQKGSRYLPAVLRIQACDDQVCYPPGTIDLQIPITVK